MKNIIVANHQKEKTNSAKQYRRDRLETEIRFQIDNSLELGWHPKDILIITNFAFAYQNIGAVVLPLNQNCLTGSKLFAMRAIFENGMKDLDSLFWIHDLDLLQNTAFSHQDIERELNGKDCGLATYSRRSKFNGGCMFYTSKAADMVYDMTEHILSNEAAKEEPTLDLFMKGVYKDRCRACNETFNVGSSGFVERFNRARKPICNIHCSLNRQAWDTFFRGKHGPETICGSPRLKKLYESYYGGVIEKYRYEDGKSPFEQRDKPIDREKAERMKL